MYNIIPLKFQCEQCVTFPIPLHWLSSVPVPAATPPVPTGQSVHWEAPAALYWFFRHEEQESAVPPTLYAPASQLRHPFSWSR